MESCSCYFDICLGFGSNIGDLESNLLKAISAVKNKVSGVAATHISSVYLSSPVGNTNQPYFLNCAILLRSVKFEKQNSIENIEFFSKRLLYVLKGIENNLGRKSESESERYMPRVIDIDILFIYDNISNNFIMVNLPELKLPHGEIYSRKFVLYPLLDLSDNLREPFDNESIKKALAKVENSDAGAYQKISYYGKFEENLGQILR